MEKSAKKAKIDLLNEELLIEKLKVLPPREYHKKLAEFNKKDWLTSILEPLIPDLKGKVLFVKFQKSFVQDFTGYTYLQFKVNEGIARKYFVPLCKEFPKEYIYIGYIEGILERGFFTPTEQYEELKAK